MLMGKSPDHARGMHVTLRQLNVFEAVARHLSYTRAAEKLHLSQPAVSMQVRQLEESTHTIELKLETGRLVVLDVDGFPITRKWFLVYRKGKRLSPAAEAFRGFVLAESGNV